MNPLFYQTRAQFLRASQQRFTGWGEANNHRRVGAALSEFHDLFVVMSSYYQRLRWITKPKPVWYRQEQLVRDRCDRLLGHTPYGRMFSKFNAYPDSASNSDRVRSGIPSGKRQIHKFTNSPIQ